ncbi:MAG: hypothetical protein Q4G33_04750 [bacterium]|nr:hypothetical protein [bacterium]
MPFYDSETGKTKHIKSFNDVFMLNGSMLLELSDIIYVGNRWCQLEFEFNIGNVQGFINNETMYISGYAEFVTEKDNIQE